MGTLRQLAEEGATSWNKGDLEAFCAGYAEDAVLTAPEGRFEGRAAITGYWQEAMTGFPGSEVTLGRFAENGDVYFGEFTFRGENTGPLIMPDGEIPPTGRTVELPGAEVARVVDGRISSHDLYYDQMGALTQLGLVPQS